MRSCENGCISLSPNTIHSIFIGQAPQVMDVIIIPGGNLMYIFVIDAATQTDAPKKSKLAAHFSNSSTILFSTSDKQIQANLSSVSHCGNI